MRTELQEMLKKVIQAEGKWCKLKFTFAGRKKKSIENDKYKSLFFLTFIKTTDFFF